MDLVKTIYHFLQKRCDINRPILLGLSGGPDSLCLFHLLLLVRQQIPLQIHVAHVDHGWRKESAEEARQLRVIVEKYALPFHLRVLDPAMLKGNLEAACREERLRFFSELCRQYGCQAVMLGHQADDQAETVLKRLLEGGSIMSLAALHEEILIDTLKIWRPLLAVPKNILETWLRERNIIPFDDKTNRDPKFLRGRFRTQIIPALSQEFGKNIQEPLCRLAKEASVLCDYLDTLVEPYFAFLVTSEMGLYLDLQEVCPLTMLEMKHLIRRLCEKGGFALAHDQLDQAAKITLIDEANRQFTKGGWTLFVDKEEALHPQWIELFALY